MTGYAKGSALRTYEEMMARCYDPNHHKYSRYGGRGIRVCDRWICRRLFLEDMGPRPPETTLNRIDNDGDYCPENCEWATAEVQSRNRGNNVNLTFRGETKCMEVWRRELGLPRSTIQRRLDRGWSVEKALSTPGVGPRKNKQQGASNEQ